MAMSEMWVDNDQSGNERVRLSVEVHLENWKCSGFCDSSHHCEGHETYALFTHKEQQQIMTISDGFTIGAYHTKPERLQWHFITASVLIVLSIRV